MAVYQDKQNTETQKFISLYGKQHLNNIIQWFNHQTFNLPTQITEQKTTQNQLKIYPNPAKNSINVEAKNAVSIEIVDVLGKIVLSKNTSTENQIDVSSLDKGIHFVKIKANNSPSFGGARAGFEMFTGKFVKE